MKILIACEYSGIVREAFKSKGHDAWSCDLLPSEIQGKHYQCDVLDILNNNWDLIIAHPPCTYLCNSGVSWLYYKNKIINTARWEEMEQGAFFFRKILEAKCDKICIENPIMHKYAKEIIGQSQSQIVHPYQFGHKEQKATCLWLKNLPLLKPTNNVKAEMMLLPINERQRIHYLPKSKDRWKERSKTFTGIAQAMADQWG